MFIKYPSIEQFRTIVKYVKGTAEYHQIPNPTIKFKGTVKLHGTNAGITLQNGYLTIQSRKNAINVEKDNAGFAWFCNANMDAIKDIIAQLPQPEGQDSLTVFGEWCGGNIQKGVALNQIEKTFVIFGAKIVSAEKDENDNATHTWLDHTVINVHGGVNILKIEDAPTYEIDINFNKPAEAQNILSELTLKVEDECPFTKSLFGKSGIGEGIVWKADWRDQHFMFKTKGEKHSVSKVKTIAAVDVEKLESIDAFVDMVVTDNRCEQGISEVFGDEGIDIKRMGEYLKWITADILKEELDTMIESGFEKSDVGRPISLKARTYFLTKWNKL